MHLIIDTEDIVNADGEGAHSEGAGSHPRPDEGEGSLMARADVGSGVENGAAAALELLREELLIRLFPGVAPQPPRSQHEGASGSAITITTVQLQQSIISSQNNDSATLCRTAFQSPPSVVGVSPAAVCCQLLPILSSVGSTGTEDAACLPFSSGSWITVWLQLSAPIPSEGVTLLARHRGGLLDARLERSNDNDGALIIKVRASQVCLFKPTG